MSSHSHLFRSSPAWFAPGEPGAPRPPPGDLASWLEEPGSLTLRLRELCGEAFQVVLLGQEEDVPFDSESAALGASGAERAVVREVWLQRGDTPLVAARSILPLETLRASAGVLAGLGTRALGEVLFSDPRLTRGQLELSEIPPRLWRQPLVDELDRAATVWGRRRVYTTGPGPLLVAEFFLPALLRAPRRA